MGEKRTAYARLWLLAFCFLGGAIVGQVLLSIAPDSLGEELRRYLSAYYRSEPVVTAAEIVKTALAYFRYPALALLLGCSASASGLLYAVCVWMACSLSFSIGCFGAAFGGKGIVLAAAALGIRCLVTLPCFFVASLSAMEYRTLSHGKGPRRAAGAADKARRGRLELCVMALLTGTGAELWCVPRLLRLTLAWILTRHFG